MNEFPSPKPCPFCGDTMQINNADVAVHVYPSDCILGTMGIPFDHMPSVVRWNTRYTPDAPA